MLGVKEPHQNLFNPTLSYFHITLEVCLPEGFKSFPANKIHR
jgi:hypothetical protein